MKNIFIFIGPSGCGKTSLANYMKTQYNAVEFISTTTREPRIGEINGKDYNFVTTKKFEEMICSNELIEHSVYAKNFYGLTKTSVYDSLSKSDICVAVMDLHGAKKVTDLFEKDNTVNVYKIFVDANFSTLLVRMRNRGDNTEKIVERLNHIIENRELYNGVYCDYQISNNSEFKTTTKNLDKVLEKILEKEL